MTPAAIAGVIFRLPRIRQKLWWATCSATAAARFSSFFEKPSDSRVPYAKAEPRMGWFRRHKTDAATRMVAFAILALAGAACRYLTTAVIGNQDLPDAGKYMMALSCAGFAFEYIVSLLG